MGKTNKPVRAKLHQSSKSMSLSDMKDLERDVLDKVSEETLRTEKKQEDIDNYNFNEVNVIDSYFEGIKLIDNTIIVRLHKENYIKEVSIMPNTSVIYDAYISQVDGRMNKAERENWVDNPLPYVYSGVIVAISPLAIAEFQKKKESLPYELQGEFHIPAVGDLVNLDHFMIADRRFYQNKQARDFIKNPKEYRIVHFDGYVKIHSSIIESIVHDKDDFYLNMSPYQQFKKFEAEGNLQKMKDEYNEKIAKNRKDDKVEESK